MRLSSIEGVRVLGEPAERLSIIPFTVEGKKPKEIAKTLDVSALQLLAETL